MWLLPLVQLILMMNAAYMTLVEHGAVATNVTRCDMQEIDELPEPTNCHPQTKTPECKAGFQAGTDGEPRCSTNLEWQRGWADAQE